MKTSKTGSLRIDNFTLNYKAHRKWASIWFTDLDYIRGQYGFSFCRDGFFISFVSRQKVYRSGSAIFLPGLDLAGDKVIKIPLLLLEFLLGTKLSLLETIKALYSFDSRIKYISIRSGEFINNSQRIKTFNCKEVFLSHLFNIGYEKFQDQIYIIDNFSDENIHWLNSIQEFLPESDRLLLKNSLGILEVTITPWWRKQHFYRFGWFLLAARQVRSEKEWPSGVKAHFDNFSSKTSLLPISYRSYWDGTSNWIYNANPFNNKPNAFN